MVCNMNAKEKAQKAIDMGYTHIAWCESYNYGSHIPSYNISSCEKMLYNGSLSASLTAGQKFSTRINWKKTVKGDDL